MSRPALKSLDHNHARRRIREWTRARFDLPGDAMIVVSERACVIPGGPPFETVVAFWTGAGTRHHFRIFKPVTDIVSDDLPFAWLKDALAQLPDFVCDCC